LLTSLVTFALDTFSPVSKKWPYFPSFVSFKGRKHIRTYAYGFVGDTEIPSSSSLLTAASASSLLTSAAAAAVAAATSPF